METYEMKCECCKHVVEIDADAPVADKLAAKVCPLCGREKTAYLTIK